EPALRWRQRDGSSGGDLILSPEELPSRCTPTSVEQDSDRGRTGTALASEGWEFWRQPDFVAGRTTTPLHTHFRSALLPQRRGIASAAAATSGQRWRAIFWYWPIHLEFTPLPPIISSDWNDLSNGAS